MMALRVEETILANPVVRPEHPLTR